MPSSDVLLAGVSVAAFCGALLYFLTQTTNSVLARYVTLGVAIALGLAAAYGQKNPEFQAYYTTAFVYAWLGLGAVTAPVAVKQVQATIDHKAEERVQERIQKALYRCTGDTNDCQCREEDCVRHLAH